MPKTKFLTQTKTSKHFYIFLILSLSMIKFTSSAPNVRQTQSDEDLDPLESVFSCKYDYPVSLSNRVCLNNNIRFDSKKYQINNFAKTENEDFLLQISEHTKYSEEFTSRLFYGLTNEGRYYFSDKSSYSHEFNINIDENAFYENNDFYYDNEIIDSKNLFVKIKNTPNKDNKYLFSINSYNFIVELYDLNNGNNNYIIWSFQEFFKLDPDDYVFLFDYELIEIKEGTEYLIAFIPQMEIKEIILDVIFMKTFKFQSFDTNAFDESGSITYQDYLGAKILDVFYMDDLKTLVVFSVDKTDDEQYAPTPIYEEDYTPVIMRVLDKAQERELGGYDEVYYKFNLKFYNLKLNPLTYIKEVVLISDFNNIYNGQDFFIKALYLNNFGEKYAIFIYFDDRNYNFIFDLFNINYKKFNNNNNPNFIYPTEGEYFWNDVYFDKEETPNDFVKIKDTQVAFMYVRQRNYLELVILLVDIYNNQLDLRDFYIDLENYYPTQIKGFAYNNHLMFSSSGGIINNKYGLYPNPNFAEYLSMFMIFGYANGTDSTIDISQFLFKEEFTEENNFFWFLYNNLTIQNDIFGYFPIGIIKLVHIPEEISISLYDMEKAEDERESPLEGPFIGSKCFMSYQDDCVDFDYIIK